MTDYKDGRETYTRQGLAIINPYGGVWTDTLFQTAEEALAHLRAYWPATHDLSEFKLAMATRTVQVFRSKGEPTYIPLPIEAVANT